MNLRPGSNYRDSVHGGHDSLLDNFAIYDSHQQAGELALLFPGRVDVIWGDSGVLLHLVIEHRHY